MTFQKASEVGLRAINILRVFNYRCGLKKEFERPSKRYGSVPNDGPAMGKDIMSQWDSMLENYYKKMGWDKDTGRPLKATLLKLGLDFLV